MAQSNDSSDPKPPSLIGTAFKTGVKAISLTTSALRSHPVRRLTGGLRFMAGNIRGVTHFIRTNSLKGLLTGEVVLDEKSLNRWFTSVEPPEGVEAVSLRCRPSRLVLVMRFERRLLGVPLGHTQVELPFEILRVRISAEGGTIELRLDREAVPEARGFVRPILVRMLSRAAADLLEERPLEHFDRYGDVIRRDGDVLHIDVSAFPPFVELMNRELRLPGGVSLFPFRAVEIYDARVEEGSLVISTRLDSDQVSGRTRRLEEELAELDTKEQLAIEIAPAPRAERDDFFDEG